MPLTTSIGEGPLAASRDDTQVKLHELLQSCREDSIETFLQKWAPVYYGLDGHLSEINATVWPILRELPPNVKAKATLAAVTSYKVDGHNVSHAFIYCEDKTSYYVGSSPMFGEFASPGNPRKIHELDDKVVVAIVLGPNADYPNAYMHISDGTIWCSGEGGCGQLGDGTFGKGFYRAEFKKVPTLRNIVAFHCGSRACTAMDIEQNVFAFGSNKFGKIAAPLADRIYRKPQQISEMKDIKPVLIACSFAHTVVATNDGKIYSHGANDHNQLGLRCDGCSHNPLLIQKYEDDPVEKIVCGDAHTLCLLKSGKLMGWGSNQDGQIGVGHQQPVEHPTNINFDGKIVVDVFAVHRTTIAITMDGCAYVSGSFDGKDVTKPWKVNPENARDHFKSGLYPSTGGGARLVRGRETLVYGSHLEETKQHLYYKEKASHEDTRRQLDQERESHGKTKDELKTVEEVLNDLIENMHTLESDKEELKNKLSQSEKEIEFLRNVVKGWSSRPSNLDVSPNAGFGLSSATYSPTLQQCTTDASAGASVVQPAVTPEEASILQKNHVFLLTNLPYEPVKDYLFQEGILSLHDLDELQALNIPKYQNEKIIKMLYRHPKGYSTLLHFLKDPANKVDWIANELCAKDAPQ